MDSAYEKKRLVKMAFLLMLLALVLTQPFAMALAIIPIERRHFHVVNGLNNATLFVHCKSKDDDLGYHHLVGSGDEFQWTFKSNLGNNIVLVLPTKAKCLCVSFEAFWIEKSHIWLDYRCTDRNCIWIAKDDGVYLRNSLDGVDELVHKWKAKLI